MLWFSPFKQNQSTVLMFVYYLTKWYKYIRLLKRLSGIVDIVVLPDWELNVIKFLNRVQNLRTEREANSARDLKLIVRHSEDMEVNTELSIVERALKRRNLNSNMEAQCIGLHFLLPTSNLRERFFQNQATL